jgi:hypothetical protein
VTTRNRKKPPNTLSPSTFFKGLGIFFLTVATVIALLIKCPTKTQYLIIYTLIGLSVTFLLYRNAGQSKLSYKLLEISLKLTGGVALIFTLYFFNPIDKFHPSNCDMPVSVSVFVHGKKGRQDMILRQQGYVIMDLHGERKRESINEKGQANFYNLHVGDHVLLNIDFSEPYKALYPDSIHVITEDGRVYLPATLEGIDKVEGRVLYNDQPLSGVIVTTNTLSDTSDATGHFNLVIPEPLQTKKYEIQLIKKDFKIRKAIAYPQTGQPIQIIMEKIVP